MNDGSGELLARELGIERLRNVSVDALLKRIHRKLQAEGLVPKRREAEEAEIRGDLEKLVDDIGWGVSLR